MKKINYILITLVMILPYISIYATGDGNPDACNVTIIETSPAEPTGFDIKGNKCNWISTPEITTYTGSDASKKADAALNETSIGINTTDDGKGNISYQYKTCSGGTKSCYWLVTTKQKKCTSIPGMSGYHPENGQWCKTESNSYKSSTCPKGDAYSCTFTCDVTCKKYTCANTQATDVLSTCAPTFQVSNGSTAYCVNSTLGFKSGEKNYKVDTDFNPRKCTSSDIRNSNNPDCGYASILIEAAYANRTLNENEKISDNAIELALRLWSVRTESAGNSKKTGLSPLVFDGKKCSKNNIGLINDINVYATTYSELFQYYRDNIGVQNNQYLELNKAAFDKFTSTSCDKNYVACGESLVVKQAWALFFNTFFGNPKFQDHLDELYGIEVSDPISISVENITDESDSKEKIETSLVWGDPLKVKEEKLKFNCNSIINNQINDSNYLNLEDSDKNYIKKLCEIGKEAYLVLPDGKEVNTNDIDLLEFMYENGKSEIRIRYDYPPVTCSRNTYQTPYYKVMIQSDKPSSSAPSSSPSSYSVQKYVICSGNPSQFQTMFAYFSPEEISFPEGLVSDDKTPGNSDNKPGYVEHKVIVNCNNECKDYSTRNSRQNCGEGTDGVYTSEVKDPSLSCIVNMSSMTNKQYYDYSNYFGVNTNLCRIYCSDEVNFYLADRTKAISGRYFKYNIGFQDALATNKEPLISSRVKQKRTCISEIYYDENYFRAIYDWKKLYGVTDEEIKQVTKDDSGIIKNWNQLVQLLNNKGKTDEVNKLLYDLYNCNLYSKDAIRNNININDTNILENINNVYNNNYGISKEWTSSITYEGGAEYGNKNVSSTNKSIIGENSKDIDIQSNKYGQVSGIKYCSVTDNNNCLEYDSIGINANTKKEDYTYSEFTTENKTTTKNLNGKNYNIPTNDYVLFNIEVEYDFYNNTQFQVSSPEGNIYKKGDTMIEKNVMDLDRYSYPMSKNAYIRCNEKLSTGESRCEITQNFTYGSFYRISGNDKFLQTLNSGNYNTYKCSVDVTPPEVGVDIQNDNPDLLKGKTLYRNVDLNDLFPIKNGRENSNWTTQYGLQATNDIQSSAARMYTSDDYLEYSYELTPSSINSIRNYNKSVKGYTNDTFVKNSCSINDKKFMNCQSEFLDNLSKDHGVIVNKGDGLSKHNSK